MQPKNWTPLAELKVMMTMLHIIIKCQEHSAVKKHFQKIIECKTLQIHLG